MNPLVAPEAQPRAFRTALSVNVNKIALLRNTRHLAIPDVVALSRQALQVLREMQLVLTQLRVIVHQTFNGRCSSAKSNYNDRFVKQVSRHLIN